MSSSVETTYPDVDIITSPQILPSDFPNIFDPNATFYTPRQYNGPKRRVRRFHNFPRFGHSRDIASLVAYHIGEKDLSKSPYFNWSGATDNNGSNSTRPTDGTTSTGIDLEGIVDVSIEANVNSGSIGTPIFNRVPSVKKSEYNSDDARSYIVGIASAGIIVMVVYLLWGIALFLLRAGRMNCCFRLCGGRMKQSDRDADDEGCCLTCHSAIFAKGGCCTRKVLCGWLAGKPPKLPTQQCLMREEQLKQKNLFEESVNRVNSSAIPGVDEDGIVAETAVATPEEDFPKAKDDKSISITEDYVRQRRESAKKSLFILRIIFLISSAIVLVSCSTLLRQGYSGINNILDEGKDTLAIFENHLEEMKNHTETYLEMNGYVREKRVQIIQGGVTNVTYLSSDNTAYGESDHGMYVAWCPAAALNNGTVEIKVPLSDILLKGSLMTLVFLNGTVNATGEESFDILTPLDNIKSDGTVIGNGAILRRILSLRDGDGGTDNNKDSNNQINNLLDTLRKMVRLLVVRSIGAPLAIGAGDDTQALLPQGFENTSSEIVESTMSKNGQEYTILSIDETNYDPSSDITFRGYNLTALFTTNVIIAVNVSKLSYHINESLNSTSDFFSDAFHDFYNGLAKMHSQTQNAQETMDAILPYYYVAVAFVSIVLFLTCIFIVGTMLAWKQSSPRFFRVTQDHVLLPLFIISGLIIWVFTTIYLTLGILSGDLCVDSPDVQVSKILEQTLSQESEVVYNFAYYYVNGCPSEYRPNLAQLAYYSVEQAKASMADFYNLVKNFNGTSLSVACGSSVLADGELSSLHALEALSFLLHEHLQSSSMALRSLAELLLCSSFHQLYSSFMYDIVCGEFVSMVGPMLWSMFLISIFSMVMVTLRVAWHELTEEDEGSENGEIVVCDVTNNCAAGVFAETCSPSPVSFEEIENAARLSESNISC